MKNNYNTLVELLYYAICINKQPIYKQDINIEIDKKELEEYLKIKLYFGQTYYSSLISLADSGNSYAQSDVGSLYFDGIINGYSEYDKSYDYYLKAAKNGQPKACWMVANLIITNRVKYDFETMWEYLNKSISLGSAAGYNTRGLCYLTGKTPDKKTSIKNAIKNFTIASEMGYSYAFNNLEHAYIYYKKAIECPLKERNRYAYYNLATYYYKDGFKALNIKKSKDKYDEYMGMYKKLKK